MAMKLLKLVLLSSCLLGSAPARASKTEPKVPAPAAAPAVAMPPLSAQIEVNFLLGYVDGSGCEFFYGGNWHDARQAQEQLRERYKLLIAANLMTDTETDFIDQGAAENGTPYQVRCAGGTPIVIKRWLRHELVRFRNF